MADRIKGITVEIGGDTTKLTQALSGVNSSIKGTQQALKDVNNLLKLDPKNTDLLKQKQELLKKAIEDTKSKLETLKQAQAQMDANGVDKNSEQYQRLQREIIATEQDLKKLEQQAKETTSVFEKIGQAGEKLKDVGGKIEGAGKALAPISAGAAAIGGAGVKSAADFDSAMSQVAATMGRTNADIKGTEYTVGEFSGTLDDFAKKLGSETAFSAKEAAEGINTLAMAGLDSEDIIAALPSVLDLAAAGSMDMASAASYAMGAVKGFGDDAANAQQYIDYMAKGATLANTDVKSLGEALGSSAATAKSYGQTADTVTVSLLKLANQNVTGSQASTMLNRAMSDLYTPTKEAAAQLDALGVNAYDANGDARDLTDVMDDLSAATSGLSEEERNAALNTIFTTNGLKAYNMMAATSAEETEKFYSALADSEGSASQQAATLLDNMNGRLTLLKSALEGAAISIGEALMPVIEKVVGSVQKAVDWFNSLDESQKQMIATILLVVAAISPLLIVIGKVISSVGSIMTVIPKLIALIGGISAPVLIVIGVIAALVAGFVTLYKTNEEFRDKVNAIWAQIQSIFTTVTDAIKSVVSAFFDVLKQWWSENGEWLIETVTAIYTAVADLISAVLDAIKVVVDAVLSFVKELWQKHGEQIKDVASKAWEFIKAKIKFFTDLIKDIINVFTSILKGDWSGAWEAIKTLLSDAWENMKNVVSTAIELVKGIIDTALEIIKTIWSTAWEWIKEKVSGIWESIKTIITDLKEGIQEKIGEVKEIIMEKIGAAMDYIKSLPERALQWGRDLIANFIAGIRERMNELNDVAEEAAMTFDEYMGFSEPEKGPLRNFHTFAPDMMDLYAQGIRDNMFKVTDAMKELSSAMVGSVPGHTANISLTTPVYLDGQVIATVVNEQLGAMI